MFKRVWERVWKGAQRPSAEQACRVSVWLVFSMVCIGFLVNMIGMLGVWGEALAVFQSGEDTVNARMNMTVRHVAREACRLSEMEESLRQMEQTVKELKAERATYMRAADAWPLVTLCLLPTWWGGVVLDRPRDAFSHLNEEARRYPKFYNGCDFRQWYLTNLSTSTSQVIQVRSQPKVDVLD